MGNSKATFIEYQLKNIGRKLHEIEQLQNNINDLQKIINDNNQAIRVGIKNIEEILQ